MPPPPPQPDIRAFYRDLPFNYWGDVAQAARSVASNPLAVYCDLEDWLDQAGQVRVLEIGCGAGWAANALALHYGASVTAVDFTPKALHRAAEVAQHLGVSDKIRFVESDLFAFDTADRFDLVLSLGVLHHTANCRAAFRHVSRFVRPGGTLFVGLYHLYGRRPFLRLMQEIAQRDGTDAARAHYARLHSDLEDDTHLESWFRDQVLHPQESQHTLEELLGWLTEAELRLVSTSVNAYDSVADTAALIAAEKTLEAVSERRNRVEGRYFPGFFTVLSQRPEAT